MFSFDKLITPKIINILYIITMLGLFAAAILMTMNDKIAAALIIITGALFCRIIFECIMVAFKNNEYLRRIAEALEEKNNPSI